MYAVIASGGKQYRVSEGDTIKLETLDAKVGAKVNFDKVLLLQDDKETKVGAPYLDKITVTGEVQEHGRHKKVHILKFHRRKHHMKQMGHRQNYTEVKITKVGEAKAAAKPKTAAKKPAEKKAATEE